MTARTETPRPHEPTMRSSFITAMADALTPEDVAANNTVIVLMRRGWGSDTITEHIDDVESLVLSRAKVIKEARAS